jgi:hypothetical protein
MSIHQCPRCELRFAHMPEVRTHLVDDHGVDPEALESHLGIGAATAAHRDTPDPMRPLRGTPAGR